MVFVVDFRRRLLFPYGKLCVKSFANVAYLWINVFSSDRSYGVYRVFLGSFYNSLTPTHRDWTISLRRLWMIRCSLSLSLNIYIYIFFFFGTSTLRSIAATMIFLHVLPTITIVLLSQWSYDRSLYYLISIVLWVVSNPVSVWPCSSFLSDLYYTCLSLLLFLSSIKHWLFHYELLNSSHLS